MDFKDMTVGDFAGGIGAETPLAGGGSVSALAGAYGAALIMMVSRKTVHNKKYAGEAERFMEIIRQAAPLCEELLDDIQGDISSFGKYKKALALPKGTEDEREKRNDALQEGLKAAAQAPLNAAARAADLLPLCRETVEKGNKNAVSDALVGILMLRAAILGAVYNIRINVQSITDDAYRGEMLRKADELQKKALESEAEILGMVPELTRCL
ncbi:cyclodeaminase/cyclohydrolase family protein [uncultured Clostridium sp.]|uniref:cyclodeaminase/cyclohydrolase family protein n=1 Tax=uncultured Clostridium sp. TaxID=59620 RepID=UPI0025CFFE78|nr:cyclodeaminase/cyclohydrolase family protein [uncultured Clostridium sp.]